MKSKSAVGVRLAVGLAAAGAITSLAGCYASEKIGKDIRDVSHDVNQGGIYMHRGALTVYRPERRVDPSPALTNASITAPATAATTTGAPAAADAPAPMATPEWQPPADGSEELPKKEAAPPAAPRAPAPPVSDGGVYSM